MNNSKVIVRVLFFAKSRELSGCTENNIYLPNTIVASELLDILCEQFNLCIIRNNIILALNENYCENYDIVLSLKDGDELAVIPPISGG